MFSEIGSGDLTIHAPLQTSFEFRKGKAFPVISGIVVAAENEDTILEASWEAEHIAAEKEREKRQQAVLKRWTKLVQGLRIRQRMREEYGGAQGDGTLGLRNVGSNSAAARGDGDDDEGDEDGTQLATAGGFLTGVQDVVQPYSLPRPTHVVFSSPPGSPGPSGRVSPAPPVDPASPASPLVDDAGYDDDDDDMVEEPRFPTEDIDGDTDDAGASSCQHPRRRIPKSMAALAAEVAQAQALANEEDSASASGSASATVPVPPNRTVTHRAASKPKSRAKKPNTRAGTRTATGTAKARGHRKRGRGRDHEADASGSGSDLEDTASDDERPDRDADMDMDVDEDEDVNVDGARSRVAKRAGKQRQGRSNLRDADRRAVQVPRSDRVLRARKGKSAEQLAREREQELAAKRAVAG